jgi:quinol monooxygenase YgiN
VVVELAVRLEHADTYARRFTEAFVAIRAYEGCRHIEAHRNQDAPEEFLILEKWASRGHYERYMEWRRGTGALDGLASILLRPMTVRYFDPVP